MEKGKKNINMRNPHIRSDDGNVMLEGDLTIAQAGQIANKLKEMLKKDESLRVTIQNVTSMDLTFIQLLYSFTKTCRQQNKKVLLDIKLNPDLELLLSKCGFNLTLMGPDK